MKGVFRKSGSIELILVPIILIVVISLTFFMVNFLSDEDTSESVLSNPACGDGTAYNSCSKNKPYFCDQGTLIEKASICGCADLFNFSDDSCVSRYQLYPEELTLSYINNGVKEEIHYTVYGEMADELSRVSREITHEEGEVPSRADFKSRTINHEEQREFLIPLVVKIQNEANNPLDQARIAVSLVQNIPYGNTGSTVSFGDGQILYSQYPYETLYYGQGICGEKSTLMAFLLKELGYDVAIFYFAEENHEAVGIKCPIEKSFKRSGYCFVETGGPAIITDSSIEYEGGIRLHSEPQIIPISDGISLPEKMQEYKDAKDLEDIRERNFFGMFKMHKLDEIQEKYGLIEQYSVG